MPSRKAASQGMSASERPVFGYCPLFVGLRYLRKKKLAYLAIVGVALSVGVIIVVMSVFSGFHRQFTAVIRGYLSDLTIRPVRGGIYGLDQWQLWRCQVLDASEHIQGAAPFIEGAGLVRCTEGGAMFHAFFRGVDPDLEGSVSDLPEYMRQGQVADLGAEHPQPEGGALKSCFVGSELLPYTPTDIESRPVELVLATATPDLRLALGKYAVNGIFQTGNYEYDSRFVILSADTVTGLLDTRGAVSGLSVRLDDYQNAPEAIGDLADRLSPGATLASLRAGTASAARLAFSGDGNRLAAALDDGRVVVWDVRQPDEAPGVAATGPVAAALALDFDGELLAVGWPDGTAAVLPVESGGQVFAVSGHGGPVTAAAFSRDGFLLALGWSTGDVEVLDSETGESVATVSLGGGQINDVDFDRDGERLGAACAESGVAVCDAESGGRLLQLDGATDAPATAVAFSPDGEAIVTGYGNGQIALWNAGGGEPLATWSAAAGAVRDVTFGRDSRTVLSADDGGLRGWHLGYDLLVPDPRLLFATDAPAGGAVAAAFRADAQQAALLGADGVVSIQHCGAGFYVRTWEDERRTLLEAVQMERFLQGLIMSLILVLAEFFIFAIVTTMVYEKRRDIGILKAVGFSHGQICQVFLTSGLAIGILGALIGVGGGLLFADNINAIREFIKARTHWDPFPPNIYYFTDIPTYIGYLTPLLTAGGAILCSLVFSIIPALRAARVDPVQTLHFE